MKSKKGGRIKDPIYPGGEQVLSVVTDENPSHDIHGHPPWFEQIGMLPEKMRKEVEARELKAMAQGTDKNREALKFIRQNGLVLVGFMPKVEYAMIDGSRDELQTCWVHHFSRPTLLYYNPKTHMGVFVNAVLRYNNTILNEIQQNKKQEISGWTG